MFKKTVYGENISKDALDQAALFYQISPYSVVISVFDVHNSRLVYLEKHSAETPVTIWATEELLSVQLANNKIFVSNRWSSVNVIFDVPEFSLVPEKYHKSVYAGDFLASNSGFEASGKALISIPHNRTGSVCDFALDSSLVSFFQKRYPNCKLQFAHALPVFMEALSLVERSNTEFYANYKDNRLSVVYFEENKLMFSNTFECETAEDILYFICAVISDLGGIAPKNARLQFWGDKAEEKTAVYDLLSDYIGWVVVGTLPKNIGYSEQIFETLPKNEYFDLLGAFHLLR